MNSLELGCQSFHIVSLSEYALLHIMPTLIFKTKILNLFQMQILNLLFQATFWFFVEAGRNPIMANDVITSSNPLVELV